MIGALRKKLSNANKDDAKSPSTCTSTSAASAASAATAAATSSPSFTSSLSPSPSPSPSTSLNADVTSTSTSTPIPSTPDPARPYARYMQQLKDYSLLMEFKKLRYQAPPGIYVMPSSESLRRWDGLIFLRKSHYRKGIFRFTLSIPDSYPDVGPRVHFLPNTVFNPLVVYETGELDLSIQFPVWSASQHYIVLLLVYIKKVFYKSEYWSPRRDRTPFNLQAQQLWLNSTDEFMRRCEQCAEQSVRSIYAPVDAACGIKLTPPEPGHEEAYRRIIKDTNKEPGFQYISWFLDGVQKLDGARR